MPSTNANVNFTAYELIERYGAKARQKVVDEIVMAVRNHDLDTAKLWDQVGQVVDERLAIPAGQMSFLIGGE